jgi:hypothetical protein
MSVTGGSEVLRINTDGTTTAVIIDPTFLIETLARPKILVDGQVFVGLINRLNDRYEIWRFAPGEITNSTVVYSESIVTSILTGWNVNRAGDLVVAEILTNGQSQLRVFRSNNPTVVNGSQTATGRYDYVFINGEGRISAIRFSTLGGNELLYWDNVQEPFERVLGTGDLVNGGTILNIFPTSDMNENGQMTLFTQLDVSPISPAFRQVVLRIDPLATTPTVNTLCSFLGDDPKPSLLDQDIYTLKGSNGEMVEVRLERAGNKNTGDRASLILIDNIRGGTKLLKTDNGSLPNEVSASLPSAGEYLVIVAEQPSFGHGIRFRGTYCLSVTGVGGAPRTLKATRWVEK